MCVQNSPKYIFALPVLLQEENPGIKATMKYRCRGTCGKISSETIEIFPVGECFVCNETKCLYMDREMPVLMQPERAGEVVKVRILSDEVRA